MFEEIKYIKSKKKTKLDKVFREQRTEKDMAYLAILSYKATVRAAEKRLNEEKSNLRWAEKKFQELKEMKYNKALTNKLFHFKE